MGGGGSEFNPHYEWGGEFGPRCEWGSEFGLDVIHGWRVNLTFIFHCYIANDYSKPNMQYNLHQCFKSL